MKGSNQFAATLLTASAGSYAGIAAAELLERNPELAERFGPDALANWKAQLQRRIVDLATAVRFESPRLFAERIDWERLAFTARGRELSDLEAAMRSLAGVLEAELPPNAWEGVAPCVREALELFERDAPLPERALDAGDPDERLALSYVATALEGRGREAIDSLLAAVDEGLPVERAYLGVLMAAQREIGRMWHMGEVSICEEHIVSGTTRRAATALVQRAERAPAVKRTVMIAGVAGNVHDFGVQAVADFLELAGYRVINVGSDCPPHDLAATCQAFAPDLLLLSATLTHNLPTLRTTVEVCRDNGPQQLKIVVGGLAFAGDDELWRQVGADGFAASAPEAVALADRLTDVSR